MSSTDSSPVPLHVPAILRNPANHALRQVEAYNAQQREHVQARRDARTAPREGGGKGKRVVRRRDNAEFASNPHISAPSMGDYLPSVPLHSRPTQLSFPPSALPRNSVIPSYTPQPHDPFSSSSINGAFSTSLKGTRAILRKRGRRVETFVGVVESELRSWLGGEGWFQGEAASTGWKVLDTHLVEISSTPNVDSSSTSPRTSRRIPQQHQTLSLPPLPYDQSTGVKQLPALLELSRSPAHRTWCVTEPFERLVVHLIVRYYELISWSEDQKTEAGESIRLTNIIQPSIVRPKIAPSLKPATPETSEVSGQSGSDGDALIASSNTEGETDSETETERASNVDEGEIAGYSFGFQPEPDSSGLATPSFESAMAELSIHSAPLERAVSNTSSMDASSEGESEFSAMEDSMTLPPVGAAPAGWVSMDLAEQAESKVTSSPQTRSPGRALVRRNVRSWDDRPTFFEYLYGA